MTRVAITTSFHQPPVDAAAQVRLQNYIGALRDADIAGELVWLPATPEQAAEQALVAARQFDGLVLSGGPDLPPQCYGEEARPDANLDLVHRDRPNFERALVTEFLALSKPVLGICYGCQFLNVWAGGTLVQDIATQWTNPIEHRDGARHAVEFAPATRLASIVQLPGCEVPSYHHQAIATPANGGVVAALAPDGMIEAIELPEYEYCIGVQWHPERDRGGAATTALFESLGAACRD